MRILMWKEALRQAGMRRTVLFLFACRQVINCSQLERSIETRRREEILCVRACGNHRVSHIGSVEMFLRRNYERPLPLFNARCYYSIMGKNTRTQPVENKNNWRVQCLAGNRGEISPARVRKLVPPAAGRKKIARGNVDGSKGAQIVPFGSHSRR